MTYNDTPYTLELVRQRVTTDENGLTVLEPGISIGQIHGRYNSEAPKELVDHIQTMIDTANQEKEEQSA